MKKRGVFNVNEERLKEFMANSTDAEGTPKTPFAEEKTTRETDIFPSVREEADKPLPVSREPVGSGVSLPEKMQEYRKIFLNRKIAVHRKQTYICYDTYRRLARILPLLSDGMTVPAFLDNVLDHHLEVYEKELDEMVRFEYPKFVLDYGTSVYLSSPAVCNIFAVQGTQNESRQEPVEERWGSPPDANGYEEVSP